MNEKGLIAFMDDMTEAMHQVKEGIAELNEDFVAYRHKRDEQIKGMKEKLNKYEDRLETLQSQVAVLKSNKDG